MLKTIVNLLYIYIYIYIISVNNYGEGSPFADVANVLEYEIVVSEFEHH